MFAVTTVSHITDIAQLSHYDDDDDDGTIKAPPPSPPLHPHPKLLVLTIFMTLL